MLVNGGGDSKLTDFGIAARAGDSPIPAGTLVYAATATFYECLVGQPPFTGDTAERLLYQHLVEPVPLDPVPEPLRPLVTAGTVKDPRDRPADAGTFVARLNAVAGGTYGGDPAPAACAARGAPPARQAPSCGRRGRNRARPRERRHGAGPDQLAQVRAAGPSGRGGAPGHADAAGHLVRAVGVRVAQGAQEGARGEPVGRVHDTAVRPAALVVAVTIQEAGPKKSKKPSPSPSPKPSPSASPSPSPSPSPSITLHPPSYPPSTSPPPGRKG